MAVAAGEGAGLQDAELVVHHNDSWKCKDSSYTHRQSCRQAFLLLGLASCWHLQRHRQVVLASPVSVKLAKTTAGCCLFAATSPLQPPEAGVHAGAANSLLPGGVLLWQPRYQRGAATNII